MRGQERERRRGREAEDADAGPQGRFLSIRRMRRGPGMGQITLHCEQCYPCSNAHFQEKV